MPAKMLMFSSQCGPPTPLFLQAIDELVGSKGLSPREREVITHMAWTFDSAADTGDALGIAEGTVRQLLRRAYAKLSLDFYPKIALRSLSRSALHRVCELAQQTQP